MSTIRLRPATVADAPAIAALHTRSWRENYADDLSADYLADTAPTERLLEWTRRFTTGDSAMRVVLAESGGELAGFCCLLLDHDPKMGTLLDNLHVRADRQGTGLGRRLVNWAQDTTRREATSKRLYLWVLDTNVRAKAVYERLGGTAGHTQRKHLPGSPANGVAATSVHWEV